MNEDQQLQQLFHRITENVSAGEAVRSAYRERTEGRSRRSTLRFRLALASGLAGATVIVGAIVLMLPATSGAAAFARMEAAIADAKTMHVRQYMTTPTGSRHLGLEQFYSKGAWRYDSFLGTKLARTYICSGPDQWNYLGCTDVAVQEPYAGLWNPGSISAIEYAEADSDEGMTNTPRDFSVEARQDEGGKAVYAIVGTRKDTPYHLEMIVDKATNLPIRSTFSGDAPSSKNFRAFTREYTFGEAIDPSVFSPQIKPTTKIIRLKAAADALKEAWKTPIQSIHAGGSSVDVRDIEVNQSGEMFIACSFGERINKQPETEAFPENVLPEAITDDMGRPYVLVDTVRPGGTFGDTRASEYMRFGKDQVAITEWAPLQPVSPWPAAKSIFVSFVARTWAGSPTYYDRSITPAATFAMPPAIQGPFPAYSSALLLDEVHLQFEMDASYDRGQHFEKEKSLADAAKWYRDAAKHARPFGWGGRFNRLAAKCEKEVGQQISP